jgi:hypothetical protein
MKRADAPTARQAPRRAHRIRAALGAAGRPSIAALALAAFVLWSHLGSGRPVFRAQVSAEPGWQAFQVDYRVSEFGEDGYFVRSVQNGYNLFYHTPRYAQRFTRKTATDAVNACANCHTPDDLAYGFVNADRFDPALGRRVSFEEHVMRCLAGPMNGYVPTLYDPTVRDLRTLARAVAHHRQLSEGALRRGG